MRTEFERKTPSISFHVSSPSYMHASSATSSSASCEDKDTVDPSCESHSPGYFLSFWNKLSHFFLCRHKELLFCLLIFHKFSLILYDMKQILGVIMKSTKIPLEMSGRSFVSKATFGSHAENSTNKRSVKWLQEIHGTRSC